MSRQTRLKQKQQSQKRTPAPKRRREPLPIAISVKHHLSAEGTATDLTVAEIEAATARQAAISQPDYLTSQVTKPTDHRNERSDRSDRTDRSDRYDHHDRDQSKRSPRSDRLRSGKSIDKSVERAAVEALDLGVQSRFVRVPNAVADQLARQLSPAEEKIFDQIWRLTVGFNRDLWRGKISDLMIRTGYSSRATVTKAIAGLSALRLIAVEGRDTNPRGRSYRIADRAQLLDYSSKTSELDHSIKKPATTHAESSRLAEPRIALPIGDPPENKGAALPSKSTSRAFKNRFEKHDHDSGFQPSSSCEDDEPASQVRLIYQDLTNNNWNKGDDSSYREIAKIPLPYIILGICYSITRASDHHVGSLKYCLPSIKEHHELMKAFPQKDLLEIAYRHLVRVKEAQRNGKWTKGS